MMKFAKWFEKNLIVGAYPDMTDSVAFDCDYIINVSDEYRPEQNRWFTYEGKRAYFWFPMNEAKGDVGLNSIYGACCILHRAETNNLKVYLHCHSGINRSQAVRAAYYYIRTGKHYENLSYNGYVNSLVGMCHRGYLPPKAEMDKFLTRLGKQFETGKYRELDLIKIETINNF